MFVFGAGIPRQHQRTSNCFENPKKSLLKPKGVASEDRALNDKDDGSDNDKEQPEKKADISQLHQWFPREMTSEKRAQKLRPDNVSLPRPG